MAARTGMAAVIDEIRLRCELGTADYSVNGSTYWTDDQIQIELDRYRVVVSEENLHIESEYTTGTVEYKDYYWRKAFVEEYDASNGEIFHLEDGGGTVIGTANYTVNYEAQHIRFSADQAGSARYLSYRAYDVDRVASNIWRKKAAHVAQRFDIASDNHNIKASQLKQHYLDMARQYAKSAHVNTVKMVRGDLNA